MPILNARNNLFRFNFPKTFLYQEIEDRYLKYVRALPLEFDSVIKYLNSTIQSVSIPGFSVSNVQQVRKNQPSEWRGGWTLPRSTSQDLSVTFKASEGYLNYFIMLELFGMYLSPSNNKEWLSSVQFELLDWGGNVFTAMEFGEISFLGITEVDPSFANITFDFKTFTTSFRFNLIQIKNPEV